MNVKPLNYRHEKRERLRAKLQTDEWLRSVVREKAISLIDTNATASVRLAMLLAAPGTYVIMVKRDDLA
jgi:hypothetical protein